MELTNVEIPRRGTAGTRQKPRTPKCIYRAGAIQVGAGAKLAIKSVLSGAGFALGGQHCAAEFPAELLISGLSFPL